MICHSCSLTFRGCGLRLRVRQCGLGQAKELSPLATAREAGMGASAELIVYFALAPTLTLPRQGRE